MGEINLFKFAPKELVTDAFLEWLFRYLDSEAHLEKAKQSFFDLFLYDDDKGKRVSSVSVRQQDEHADLIVVFQLDGFKKAILFENKTWSTIHGTQLEDYKKSHPDFYRYFYLKLAYINYAERLAASKYGYDVISSKQLLMSLESKKELHPFIQHYSEYLKETFTDYMDSLSEELYMKNNSALLDNSQAQAFIISNIHEKLDGRLPYLLFKTGSSFGRPWTQIDFAKKENIYGNKEEYLFWRIDRRSNQYYIRLNQWAGIDPSRKDFKFKRLVKLRQIGSDLSKKYNLKGGPLSNRGIWESEVVIFFLGENRIEELVGRLPQFSIDFHNEYMELEVTNDEAALP